MTLTLGCLSKNTALNLLNSDLTHIPLVDKQISGLTLFSGHFTDSIIQAEAQSSDVVKCRMTPVVAIAWMRHRRLVGLCQRLDAPLYALETRSKGVARYWEHTRATIKLLREHRPRALIVQNPSIVLTFLAVLLRPWFGYRLFVDAHNEAVRPFLYDNAVVRWVARFLLRRADCTIVTNSNLAKVVRAARGKPFVLTDPIDLTMEVAGTPPASQPPAFVVISTYEKDEPLAEVFAAARRLEGTATFAVTGNSKKLAPELRAVLPNNVSLTGFLPEEAYWDLLRNASAIIDLTTLNDCLVCGAYEALSLAKPMVLSQNGASVETFGPAAIHVENFAQSIEQGLRQMIAELSEMTSSAARFRPQFDRAWTIRCAELKMQLAQDAPST
jgi:glycosyltransferase involved in cell wall biosynthesis